MGEFDPDVVDALNALLEDERASVEMEVALASGATEIREREALTAMGVEDISFCESLRTWMEQLDAPVTRHINGVVFQVLGTERYDDRLRAFARHQRSVSERRSSLMDLALDDESRAIVEHVCDAHERHVIWCERRADAFFATRIIEPQGALAFASTSTQQGEEAEQGDQATLSPVSAISVSVVPPDSSRRASSALHSYDTAYTAIAPYATAEQPADQYGEQRDTGTMAAPLRRIAGSGRSRSLLRRLRASGGEDSVR